MAEAAIGVFGGSGFYSFLDDVEEVTLQTPYGLPSAPVTIGTIGPHRVAFIPRHGRNHEHSPARLPYRANLWAMRMLGVRTIVAPCAVGSLRHAIEPGDFVVLDQLVDRTRGRDDTYYDADKVHHVSFAHPYCEPLRQLAIKAGERADVTMHPAGTLIVINGPRFSTKAESRFYSGQGWDVVGMTGYPEAYLARELGLHYAGIALATDYDAGLEDDPSIEPVTQEQVFAVFESNVTRVRALLLELIPQIPAAIDGCGCEAAIGPLPHPLPR
jgi:5'-methylthioadenosine phosphorylase